MAPRQNSESGLSSKSSNNSGSLVFHVLTLFPDIFPPFLDFSLLGKAREKGLVDFNLVQIRDFAQDKHKTVDDSPYGGGPGMLLRADVLTAAWESVAGIEAQAARERPRGKKTILLSPQGKLLTQEKMKELAGESELILVSGHYEGVDERFIELCVDEEISIGDYVLTGGELPALVLIDGVSRLIPGVVGREGSVKEDSLEGGLLKYPQYTRPAEFRGLRVPEVLLGGDHGKIARWRREQAEERTRRKRPDLIEK